MQKKYFYFLVFLFFTNTLTAQTVEDIIEQKVKYFNKVVFENKDSVALENLLCNNATYGHSGGKVENKKDMIGGVMVSKSTYQNVQTIIETILINGKSVVVRHLLTAIETDKNGKTNPLKLNILQVWIKEKKEWKLLARQAVKII